MKPFRIRRRDNSNVHVNVVVNPEVIPEGGCYDVPPPPKFPKPRLKPKFVAKITPPTVDGFIQYVHRGL